MDKTIYQESEETTKKDQINTREGSEKVVESHEGQSFVQNVSLYHQKNNNNMNSLAASNIEYRPYYQRPSI